MATKAISATTMLISESNEIKSPLASAYKYRIMISVWRETGKPEIINILTNSITYANITSRQFNCLKFENGEQVVEFSASLEEGDEMNGNNGNGNGDNKEKDDNKKVDRKDEKEDSPNPSPKQKASAKPALAANE